MEPIDLATAEVVKNAIRRTTLSQATVAKLAGIAPSTWSRRMKGEDGFRVWELMKVAKVLETSPGDLMDEAFIAAAKQSGVELKKAS